MLGPVTTTALDPILRGVSRSIYLTLKVAPGCLRSQLGVAYLFCRAADTIADTRLLSRENRLESLHIFRGQFERESPSLDEIRSLGSRTGKAQRIPEEQALLRRLEECFEAYGRFCADDQVLVRKLVTTLTRGMEMDLTRFPAEESGKTAALESDAELDLYTYHVAGCVGEFWTDLEVAHLRALGHWSLSEMREKGIRFGKGLQMTNILRDVDRDLGIGRIYFSAERLAAVGLTAEELRAGRSRRKLKPILDDYLAVTLEHYRAGWEYTLAIPRQLVRLRLACAWPLLIGLRTLALIGASPDPYAPGTIHKVPRPEVKAILRRSVLRVLSNRRLSALYTELGGRLLS